MQNKPKISSALIWEYDLDTFNYEMPMRTKKHTSSDETEGSMSPLKININYSSNMGIPYGN